MAKDNPAHVLDGGAPMSLPKGFVPTPTSEYRSFRKQRNVVSQDARAAWTTAAPRAKPLPEPVPVPRPVGGARILMIKQDPTVGEIGIRKAYLPGLILAGPRDSRIVLGGVAPVPPNAMGDFIAAPWTEPFDAVHTFAVVRQTLWMYQRALGGAPLPWQWNVQGNTNPITVHPRAGVTMNAYYSRAERALKFFHFTKPGSAPPVTVYTCRSFDIVSHETGHAILDALKPAWIMANNPPQTGALHEAFGDLTAIFLALSEFDMVEAVIAQTKANLHDKTFLSDLAEEFGLALGRPNGLRNADNDLKLSQVGNEVHDLSQVFTGAIYDILADFFVIERAVAKKDDAQTLLEVGAYLRGLLLRALGAAPAPRATFVHVANAMLAQCTADGKPDAYRKAIVNQFVRREIAVPGGHAVKGPGPVVLAAAREEEAEAVQDRHGCCGTMRHEEYSGYEELLNDEMKQLADSFAKHE